MSARGFQCSRHTVSNLRAFLRERCDPPLPAPGLRALVEAGWAELPNPGSGSTLDRWRMLATVAEHDLALAKLFESHADALAILSELDGCAADSPGSRWAVWCAEPPGKRVTVQCEPDRADRVRLYGTKAWCSGAEHVTHALVSGWNAMDQQCLMTVSMRQPEIHVTQDGWQAVGMAATASVDVVFNGATGTVVGGPGTYVGRPGFQHGAAGIAACWYGAAAAIGAEVCQALRQRDDVHALAHLGAIDVALAQARSQLLAAAAQIDAHPQDTCEQAVRRARLSVEAAAETAILRAPRAVGAGPLCKNPRFARLMADLPVFIRQSHAERDLASHGREIAKQAPEESWTL